MCSLQHAFQIDALILKALLDRYIPNVRKFLDVSVGVVVVDYWYPSYFEDFSADNL